MADDAVSFEVIDRVPVVTYNSPPANAFSEEVIAGMAAAVDQVEASEAAVAVFRSAIPGFFIAGANLKFMAQTDKDGFLDYLARLRGQIERVATARFISIAAIDGHALGGGLEFAVACSLRVASERARLGVPEVKLGLLPGAGGSQRLPKMLGKGPGLDLLLSGRSATGEEGYRLGLVDRYVGDGDVDAAAIQWAKELLDGPADAYAWILRCAAAARDLPLEEGMEVERQAAAELFDTPDGLEGVAAFVEKRQAEFGKRRTS